MGRLRRRIHERVAEEDEAVLSSGEADIDEEFPDITNDEKTSTVPKSMRGRWLSSSLSTIIIFLGAALVLFTASVYVALSYRLRQEVASKVNTSVAAMSENLKGEKKEISETACNYVYCFVDRSACELQILDEEGKVLAASSGSGIGSKIGTSEWITALTNNSVNFYKGVNPDSGERILSGCRVLTQNDGTVLFLVRCVSSYSAVTHELTKIVLIAGAGVLLVLAMIIISNALFIRSLLEPLQQITETAKQIAQGRYGVHIVPVYSYEIGILCDTINDMSDAISRSERTKNEFISSVSHELRTPLTAIAGWSETLLSGEQYTQNAELRRGLQIIRDEAARLSGMVEELLDFSRMENGELTVRMAPFDLAAVVEDIVFMYYEPLQTEGIILEFQEDDFIPEIVGDSARLRQVILNILENARKHGGSGGRITVTVRSEGDEVSVTVADCGPGIPPDELPHVRERFFKGSSKARGSGIGLAMADEIVRLHGGRLDIESQYGAGTTVIITLPAADSAQMGTDNN